MTQDAPTNSISATSPVPVTWREAFWTWLRVAALSFGGPAGQIAVMHRIVVDEKRWISEKRFLHALNYCMLLPGPEAQQLATYIGWLLHRARGGLLAGILFILPGFASILALSVLYVSMDDWIAVQVLFHGLKAAVLAIVIQAVLRIGKRVLKNGAMRTIAVLAFLAIFFGNVPFPLLILVAGVVGLVGGQLAPHRFVVSMGHRGQGSSKTDSERSSTNICLPGATIRPTWARAVRVSAVCLTLWFGPLVAVYWWLGSESIYWQQGVFFSQTAVVTFGGAYSVLAYVAQQAVDRFGWLRAGEMLDGLGMAETTPGPLIMVLQFVGFVGAYRAPGPFEPLVAGVLASVLTTWVTFVPCFYWIFLGAPYVESLRNNARWNAALSCITAAVVGVVLNLAIWLGLHTMFGTVHEYHRGGLRWLVPDLSTPQVGTAVLALLAVLLTFVFRRGLGVTLATCCAASAVGHWLFRST